MIKSENGVVDFAYPKNEIAAKAEVYADLACIFAAITSEFGLSTLLDYLEFYTSKEINTDGSRD